MPTDVQRTILAIAMDAQRQQRERAALARGQFVQKFNPVMAQAAAMDEPDVFLPAIQQIGRAKLASLTNQGGGGGGSQDGSPLSTELQRLVKEGYTTERAAREVEKLRNAREQVKIGKNPKKFNLFSMDILRDAPKKVGGAVLQGALKGLDYLSRPGLAVTTAMAGQAQDLKDLFQGDFETKELWDVAKGGLAGGVARWKDYAEGAQKKEGKFKTGSDVLDTLGWNTKGDKNIANRIAHAAAGFGVDVVADPTTYLSFGTTSVGKNLAKELADVGIKGTAKKLVQSKVDDVARTVRTGAAQKTKRLVSSEAEAIGQKIVQEEFKPILVRGANQANLPVRNITTDKTLQKIITEARKKIDPGYYIEQELNRVAKEIEGAVMNSYGKGALQFRPGFLGKGTDILDSGRLAQTLYKPLEAGSELLGKIRPTKLLGDNLIHERAFPGLTNRLRAIASSKGYHAFMEQRKKIINVLDGFSDEERKAMSHMIERGGTYGATETVEKTGRLKNDVLQDVKDLFKEMADQDVSIAHKAKSDMLDDQYVYHYFRKPWKDKDNIDKWRKDRKDMLSQMTGHMGLTLEAAQKKGLNPIEDIREILLARQAKGNRDAVRQWFRHDVVENYGTFVKNHDLLQNDVGNLVEVKKKDLSTAQRKLADAQDGKFYLPKEIHGTFKTLGDLNNINDPNVNTFLRWMDTANRHFKYAKTVPNPSYHVRNFISDAMFSWLDQGKLRDYGKYAAAKRAMRNGGDPEFMADGFAKKSYRWLEDEYRNRIGVGGYYPTEVTRPDRPISGLNQGLRKFAEGREDFGRIAHFKSAFEQELKKIRKGQNLTGKKLDDAMEQALAAASDRVNKFNIDYSALTPIEQKYIRRAIPFYTFLRKAAPLMMEQMATNPGRALMMDKLTRAIEEGLGVEGTLPFADFGIPDYIKESGLMRLNNESEPSFLRMDFSPQGVIPGIFGNTGDPGQAGQNILSRLNPAVRLPFEVWRGKKLFGGKPVKSAADAIWEDINPLEGWTQMGNRVIAPEETTSGAPISDDMLRFLGIPLYRGTEERQIGATKFVEEKFKSQVGKMNKALEERGYDFTTTTKKGRKVYRIVDRVNGTILYESDDPSETREVANSLYG